MDPLAVAALRPQLLDYAMLRLRNRERAEDAVQEALVAALEGLHRFAGESTLRTWVMGILKHKIADIVKGAGRMEPWEADESAAPESDCSPESSLARRRALESVERRLRQLPDRAASVFVARDVLGMSVAEVCRALAISSNHCSVLLHRARSRLRQCPALAAHAV